MTRALTALAFASLLAACGVDGAPVPPRDAPQSSSGNGTTLTVTGDARFGAEATL
jgi:hypothetical protein